MSAIAAATVLLPACAGGSTLGNVLGGVLGGGGAQQSQVLVEVQGVDPRQQAIQVRTEQGESGAVLFDQNTVVVYRQQQYPVTALERGDVAVMQLEPVDQNRLYTPHVEVRQSVQERTGQGGQSGAGALVQVSGQVGEIDRSRGAFELRTEQGIFTVLLPQNAGAALRERYEALRTGSAVSVEGTRVGADGIGLRRFL